MIDKVAVVSFPRFNDPKHVHTVPITSSTPSTCIRMSQTVAHSLPSVEMVLFFFSIIRSDILDRREVKYRSASVMARPCIIIG